MTVRRRLQTLRRSPTLRVRNAPLAPGLRRLLDSPSRGAGGGGAPSLPSGALLDIDPALGVTTSGGRVTQITDQAGGVTFTVPGGGAVGPTYVASYAPLGGRPALLYDGGTTLEILTASGFASAAVDWTVYGVVDVQSATSEQRLLDRTDGGSRIALYPRRATVVRVFDGSFRTYAAWAPGPQALTWRFTAVASEAWRGAGTPASLGASGSGSQAWSGTLAIGGDSSTADVSRQMDGHIARVLLYPVAHDASQRAAVWAYLASEYGV